MTAASLLAVLALGGAVASQEKTARPARILFPPDRAVLLSGHFDVIVRAPRADLVIDGRPQAWEAFAPPVHVLRVSLDPGPHSLWWRARTPHRGRRLHRRSGGAAGWPSSAAIRSTRRKNAAAIVTS